MAKQLVDIDVIEKDIIIPKGSDYEQSFTIINKMTNTGVDFTGFASCKIDSKFKQNFESVSFAGTFTPSFTDSGVVTLSLTDTQTTNLSVGRYFYDVVSTLEFKTGADENSDLHTVRLVQGQIIVE
tara:strand:+ start:2640 stop:3017 length:378 start_codon:yes stop_codon:yes gene_type:complete